MRYFLICVAAFMLLAAPAFAAEEQDLTVTVDIEAIGNFGISDFNYTEGEGYLHFTEFNNFTGGPWGIGGVTYWVQTNNPWKLKGKFATTDTNWLSSWLVQYKANGDTGFTSLTDTMAALDTGDNGDNTWDLDFQVAGIVWGDGPTPDGGATGTISLWLGNE